VEQRRLLVRWQRGEGGKEVESGESVRPGALQDAGRELDVVRWRARLLRAEQLAAIYEPDVIVVGFIPHDVLRCQMSYWSGNAKPYFDLDAAGLRLHPAPVPEPPWWAPLKPLLATSATVQALFPTLLDWEGPYQVDAHDRAREVACALMGRLAALGRERGARVVLVAHPQQPASAPEEVELAAGVLQCARAQGLTAVDLFPAFAALPPAQQAALFRGHLSTQGNALVADQLATVIGPAAGAQRTP